MGFCFRDPIFGLVLGDSDCLDSYYDYKLGKSVSKQVNKTERVKARQAPDSEGPVESVAGSLFGFLGDRAEEGALLAGGLLGAETATTLAPTLVVGAVAVGGAILLATAVRR